MSAHQKRRDPGGNRGHAQAGGLRPWNAAEVGRWIADCIAARCKGGGMNRPNEIALTPDSLAADGNQGESAKAQDQCGVQDTPQAAAARFLALTALDVARGHLVRYALVTDTPARGIVEAADLLDAAADCLAPIAEFSDAIKGARGGDA